MLEMIKHKLALSDEGAKDMIKACISAAISDFILMGPAGILYMLIEDMLAGKIESNKIYVYIAWTLVGSYFVNRAICSFGSSYQRFDAHGNAFFGKSGGNSVLNYASSKLKQMGATEISNIGLLGLDYLFGTYITYKNYRRRTR